MNYKLKKKINLRRKKSDSWRIGERKIMCVVYYGRFILVDKDYKGTVPHFHIEGYFRTGIMIHRAEYCHHGQTDMLDDYGKMWLMNVLKHKAEYKDMTNWELVLQTWNECNPNHQLPLDLRMPDYMQLKQSLFATRTNSAN